MNGQKLVAWGGYDASKPRVRLLLDALRRRDALHAEIAIDVWSGVEDKSVAGKGRAVKAGLKLLLGMPRAALELLRSPHGIDVLLPYPGTPDIFVAAIIAKLQGRRVILDAFLPIHDTIVGDRAMINPKGILAKAIRLYEKAGLRLADVILTDTDAHADFFADDFGIDRARFETVLVGAESLFTPPPDLPDSPAPVTPALPKGKKIVLFYGQLIPLHGLSTILAASQIAPDENTHWIVIGDGQQREELANFMDGLGRASNITWEKWVDYERLPALIARADLCLGVFGGSDKAARVIPNKVFQQLAMGKPVITRSSPAIDALARAYPETIRTVPAEDPAALADAVRQALGKGASLTGLPADTLRELTPDAGVDSLLARLSRGE